MNSTSSQDPLRPRDLALVLLASRDLSPRKRARDQQADLAGMALKRRVLEEVAALDPEPEFVEAALAQIVETLGPPFGPARAIAAIVRDEWQMACATPEWVAHLLAEAIDTPASNDSKSTSRG
jgi:hypothetical protein